MTEPTKSTREQIDAYLDGALRPEGAAAFERALATDDALRAEIAAHRLIEESLRRSYEPRIPKRLDAMLSGGAARRAWWGLAAVLVIGAAGIGALWLLRTPAPPVSIISESLAMASPLDALYQHQERTGFRPTVPCETDEEFAAWVSGRFGEPLVAARTPGVEAMGWSYATTLSPHTGLLLARVDGRGAVIIVDRVEEDRELRLPDESPLHLFKRTIGGLALYELTPLDEPRVLPTLRTP